jgi:plasmid stabilization system protein ParE
VWTERAVADLERIGDYIAADNPTAAERWVNDLVSAAARLAGMPFSGRRVPEIGSEDIREVLKGAYRIVYRLRGDRAEILTVFEGHRLFPADVAGESD